YDSVRTPFQLQTNSQALPREKALCKSTLLLRSSLVTWLLPKDPTIHLLLIVACSSLIPTLPAAACAAQANRLAPPSPRDAPPPSSRSRASPARARQPHAHADACRLVPRPLLRRQPALSSYAHAPRRLVTRPAALSSTPCRAAGASSRAPPRPSLNVGEAATEGSGEAGLGRA
ncbi:uncharacterized protein A4U43_C10F9800, partial [Asparagus officinalis]